MASFMDPVLSPLLLLSPVLGILVISFIIALISTVAYKYLTDQNKLKKIRAEMKEYQKKIKELSKKEPDKAMKMQGEMMSKNMEMMKQSFKPMLFTFLPLILIFGWLNTHMAYEPINPQETFSVTIEMIKGAEGNVTLSTRPALQISTETPATQLLSQGTATWTLKGGEGTYEMIFNHKGLTQSATVAITGEAGRYENPVQRLSEPYKEVTMGNKKIRPLQGVPLIGGWGWLGTYILFSFAFSIGLRKAMKLA